MGILHTSYGIVFFVIHSNPCDGFVGLTRLGHSSVNHNGICRKTYEVHCMQYVRDWAISVFTHALTSQH